MLEIAITDVLESLLIGPVRPLNVGFSNEPDST